MASFLPGYNLLEPLLPLDQEEFLLQEQVARRAWMDSLEPGAKETWRYNAE